MKDLCAQAVPDTMESAKLDVDYEYYRPHARVFVVCRTSRTRGVSQLANGIAIELNALIQNANGLTAVDALAELRGEPQWYIIYVCQKGSYLPPVYPPRMTVIYDDGKGNASALASQCFDEIACGKANSIIPCVYYAPMVPDSLEFRWCPTYVQRLIHMWTFATRIKRYVPVVGGGAGTRGAK